MTHPGMDPLDGHHLLAALLQAVGEHGPEHGRGGRQHHLVRHKVHGVQVVVADAQRHVAQLPLLPQLIHDGEGRSRVAAQRVAEDPVPVTGGRRHQGLALGHRVRHRPAFHLLLLLPRPLRRLRRRRRRRRPPPPL